MGHCSLNFPSDELTPHRGVTDAVYEIHPDFGGRNPSNVLTEYLFLNGVSYAVVGHSCIRKEKLGAAKSLIRVPKMGQMS